jgi:hypothetical protein
VSNDAAGNGTATLNRGQRRGFVAQRKVFRLDFQGTDLEGLVVRAKSVPLGTFLELMELAQGLENLGDLTQLTELSELPPGSVAAIRGLLEGCGHALVDWNLEDEDTGPVEASPAGLNGLDLDVAMAILQAWMTAVAGVSGPLGQPSSDGKPSLAASLPMEPSTPSPAL